MYSLSFFVNITFIELIRGSFIISFMSQNIFQLALEYFVAHNFANASPFTLLYFYEFDDVFSTLHNLSKTQVGVVN